MLQFPEPPPKSSIKLCPITQVERGVTYECSLPEKHLSLHKWYDPNPPNYGEDS